MDIETRWVPIDSLNRVPTEARVEIPSCSILRHSSDVPYRDFERDILVFFKTVLQSAAEPYRCLQSAKVDFSIRPEITPEDRSITATVIIKNGDTVLPICHKGLNRSVAMYHVVYPATQFMRDLRLLPQLSSDYHLQGETTQPWRWNILNQHYPCGWEGSRPTPYCVKKDISYDRFYHSKLIATTRKEIRETQTRGGVFHMVVMAHECISSVLNFVSHVVSEGNDLLGSSIKIHFFHVGDYIANPKILAKRVPGGEDAVKRYGGTHGYVMTQMLAPHLVFVDEDKTAATTSVSMASERDLV